MFIDSVRIIVKGGTGGNGAATLRRTAQSAKGGPDGGDGGDGGNVYFRGSTSVNDLSMFRYKKKVIAPDGTAGQKKNLFGKNGEHKIVELPVGTAIKEEDTGKIIQVTDTTTLIPIAYGGKGGRGNYHFKTATNQTPRTAELGEMGEARTIVLDLRIIARIGITGLPNAGKSSLLSVLTHATPKIGNYPFTTLEPNVGMMGSFAVADIPGIIEGAAAGKGLGIKFLKHIEKTRVLVHCVDVSGEDPEKAHEVVRTEFEKYNPGLLNKPEVILLTKIDLIDAGTLKKYRTLFEKKGLTVLTYSLYDPKSIDALKTTLEKMVS